MKTHLVMAGMLAALLAGCGSEEKVCDFSKVVTMPS